MFAYKLQQCHHGARERYRATTARLNVFTQPWSTTTTTSTHTHTHILFRCMYSLVDNVSRQCSVGLCWAFSVSLSLSVSLRSTDINYALELMFTHCALSTRRTARTVHIDCVRHASNVHVPYLSGRAKCLRLKLKLQARNRHQRHAGAQCAWCTIGGHMKFAQSSWVENGCKCFALDWRLALFVSRILTSTRMFYQCVPIWSSAA